MTTTNDILKAIKDDGIDFVDPRLKGKSNDTSRHAVTMFLAQYGSR
jgi:hypothetical protein